jgi:hypothetical protein
MDAAQEFQEVRQELIDFASRADMAIYADEMARLEVQANAMGRAWSGSSLGYHGDVYTKTLEARQPGTHFDVWLGLQSKKTAGYQKYDPEFVREVVLSRAGSPNLAGARRQIEAIFKQIDYAKTSAESIVGIEPTLRADSFIAERLAALKGLRPSTDDEYFRRIVPLNVPTADDEAASGGFRPGAHHRLLAEAMAFQQAQTALGEASTIIGQLVKHAARMSARVPPPPPVGLPSTLTTAVTSPPPAAPPRALTTAGKRVFIGHGHSSAWKDLRDFIRDRVLLDYDEFNRVPVAGTSNKERLTEMLDASAIAFLILTGEDETSDGKTNPRLNVVHEVGLFQGRHGFGRAIVLVEEGCEGFSNIEGVGYIKFPKGGIAAKFEEIRRVLEREGFLIPAARVAIE